MAATAIITGGAGFIGSHLAEALLREGWDVRILDNLSTGRAENINHLLGDRCTLTQADAADALDHDHDQALWDHADAVFHLAASVGVQKVLEDPTGMIRNNVDETARIVDAATRHNATLLVASSSEVYGRSENLPLTEQGDLVFGPTTSSRWAYGMAKALDEHLVLDAVRQRDLSAVIVRLFNTIGPRQVGHYGMVVPRFVERAVNNQPLRVFGDGNQTRAFCDVRDVVDAMIALVTTPETHGRTYNLGSENEITIRQLADLVVRLAESGSDIEFVPYEQAYPPGFEETPQRAPSTQRLREAIGFRPRYTLEQTIRELVRQAENSTQEVTTVEKK
ncbi:NAD-dependent epimerase/dehydratase family protein [Mucisphaera calidilacus]|uniref:dTDP-glucose 4,6-dehydratase n=1 Tax=Mucisphaera calidilacus TaxID=2527982 RepID=A0A518BTF5_9BACT|nr:NAD-dependent epimerase/dehydratase family protein [Mucisphaera calidilacus]QDU70253.1 dTDP-glucose 4,6-dehydratase [Mucisphaera calidilacus]